MEVIPVPQAKPKYVTCNIRQTEPVGPWELCRGLDCFPSCFVYSYGRTHGEDPTPEAINMVIQEVRL